MTRRGSSQGKVGCFPLLLCFVVVFVVIAAWQNRAILGVKGDYDYLTWLGLSSGEATSSSPDSSPRPALLPSEEGVTHTVTLYDPVQQAQEAARRERENRLINEKNQTPNVDRSLSRAYESATLNQAVLFIFKKNSGSDSRRVMPKGTVVEVVETANARVKIRMMGREGWLSMEAVE